VVVLVVWIAGEARSGCVAELSGRGLAELLIDVTVAVHDQQQARRQQPNGLGHHPHRFRGGPGGQDDQAGVFHRFGRDGVPVLRRQVEACPAWQSLAVTRVAEAYQPAVRLEAPAQWAETGQTSQVTVRCTSRIQGLM
jgi:hypothetical protein